MVFKACQKQHSHHGPYNLPPVASSCPAYCITSSSQFWNSLPSKDDANNDVEGDAAGGGESEDEERVFGFRGGIFFKKSDVT